MNKRIRKKKEKERSEWFRSQRTPESDAFSDAVGSWLTGFHVIVTIVDEESVRDANRRNHGPQ